MMMKIGHLNTQSMKAIWNDVVIAESNETVVIEGKHYFPIDPSGLAKGIKDRVAFWKGVKIVR
jgi:uncharacterized protein (DUF427 family)